MDRFCVAMHHGMWSRQPSAAGVSTVADVATTADRLGFDSVWISEDPDGWDAFALLAFLAPITTSVRLGPGVVNPYMRHPNLMAASIATLDQVSNGRAFLGVGRGQVEWYQQRFGMPVVQPLQRLETTIDLLRDWWRPDRVATSSLDPVVSAWHREISPIHEVPIYLAAVGPRALELAARKANGVLFNELATPRFVRRAVGLVKRSAIESGRDPSAFSFFVNPATRIADDPLPWLQRKRAMVASIHSLPGMEQLLESEQFDVTALMRQVRATMRTEELLAEGRTIAEMRLEGDFIEAQSLIPTGLIAESTAIGTPEHVAAKLAEFIDAGATHFFFDSSAIVGQDASIEMVARRLIDLV